MRKDQLQSFGVLDARVPRYTSYPPATAFKPDVGAVFQESCLRDLDPDEPVSIYVHIPFCERLCWFCACHTQGTKTLGPVESYLQSVRAELMLLREALPDGVRMGRLHWGGGTPTILPPDLIRQLATDIMEAIPPADPFDFAVEIDPTYVDNDKIEALAHMGMTRASIGIQDFSVAVQDAIGRHQSFEKTEACVAMLRAARVDSLNADLVYGLPLQTPEMIDTSISKILQLRPDRVALFGYAHVPHLAKRQRLIDEEQLPGDLARHTLSELARKKLVTAGFETIGIDHFSRTGDTLAKAKRAGTLRRNFQGYTDDTCQTLIGIGASAISRFSGGYVQNASATTAYKDRIDAGLLAGHRGHLHSGEDLLRGRAIEMIMCDYEIDLVELSDVFGDQAKSLSHDHTTVLRRFQGFVSRDQDRIQVAPEGRLLARLIANVYDRSHARTAIYSKVS